jgi:hypothetical protein
MTSIVVGGHSRNVGKTSVTAALIRAFKEYPWTAIKISSHQHLDIHIHPHEKREHDCSIYEELDREGSSDTSRFLAAGASRALWMQLKGDSLDDSLKDLQPILQSSPFIIIESNRILRFVQPDLCIMVLRYDVEDFKQSARRALRQAHAIVAVNPDFSPPPWEGVSEILARIPQFSTPDPQIIPAGLIDFARQQLRQSGLD